MKNYHLPENELIHLKKEHRQCKSKRDADKIKAVYLLGLGWTIRNISEALLMDEDTVSSYFKKYKQGGIYELLHDNYCGGCSYLNSAELSKLNSHLENNLFRNSYAVVKYIIDTFNIGYSARGVVKLLGSLSYSYKKTRTVPGKTNAESQSSFITEYRNLMKTKGESPVYFLDSTHPQHNVHNGYGWIKKCCDWVFPSNTGRKRVNIHGALNIETKDVISLFENKIDSHAVIRLVKEIELSHPDCDSIYCVCDNASYYHALIVQEYLKTSKVKFIFLPPYSPNLNIIERLWKFFKNKFLTEYYEKFSTFEQACVEFFENLHIYKRELESLLTDNFETIN